MPDGENSSAMFCLTSLQPALIYLKGNRHVQSTLQVDPAVQFRSRERQESARLARCRASQRRSLHPSDSGRSALAAGTRPHASKPTPVITLTNGEVG